MGTTVVVNGQDNVVGIVVHYRLNPGFESMGARQPVPLQTGPEVHPASCTMGTRSLSWGKKCLGHGNDHLPHPVPGSRLGRAILPPPLCICIVMLKGATFTFHLLQQLFILIECFKCVSLQYYIALVMDVRRVWRIGGMKLTGENHNSWRKPYPSAIFFHHISHTDWPRD